MATDPVEIINTIINNAITNANEFTESADDAATDLIRENIGLYVTPPDESTGFEVSAVEPEIPTPTDSIITYEAQLEKVVALLSDQLSGFFATYYPLESDAFDEATNHIVNTITNGGRGINTAIESQLWQRMRERISTETRKQEDQITEGYASRGYVLPSGAMIKQVQEVRLAGLAASGLASTDVADKQFQQEIRTVEFAITKAIESRSMAMNAAADYIRAIATAPDSAIKTVNMTDENRARLMNAASNWYGARLDRDKIVLNSKLAELDTRFKVYDHRRTTATKNDAVKVQALGHAADVYARTASAALASLNSIVSTAAVNF